MENVILQVNGMSCGHCVKAIEGSVGELHGVANVSVDLEHAQVTVQFDAGVISLDEIKEVIDEQGYDVK